MRARPSVRPTPHRPSLGSLGAAILLATVALVGVAPTAGAHAYLSSSSPADGDSLQSGPAEVRLDFSEHVQLSATRITLVDSTGHSTVLGDVRLVQTPVVGAGDASDAAGSASGSPAGPVADSDPSAADGPGPTDASAGENTESPVSIVARLPTLARGAYHVTWETLSSDDLHRTAGVFAFGVHDAVDAVGLTETTPEGADVLARWVLLSGLALALGALLVSLTLLSAVREPPARSRLWRRMERVRRLGALAAALAAVALLAVELSRSGADALTMPYAAKWVGRELGFLLLARPLPGPPWHAADRRGRAPARIAVPALVIGAAAACLGTVVLGHFGSRGGATWVLASSLHLAAGAAWAGAVLALADASIRRGTPRLGRDDLGSLLRAFRGPAAALVTVVVVTGVLLAGDVVGSVDAALLTLYGRVLLVKIGLVALALLLALRTTRALRSTEATGSSRRIGLEAAVGVVVLALAGTLASGQPALQPELVSSGPPPSQIIDRHVSDLQETLMVRPNRPGASIAFVDVLDTRRPSVGPVLGVSVVVATAAPVEATRVDDARWAANLTLPSSGELPVRVLVRRRGVDTVVSTYAWVVARSAGSRPTVVSAAPIGGLLRAAAVTLLLLAALLWWIALQRRRLHWHGEPERSAEPSRQRGAQP